VRLKAGEKGQLNIAQGTKNGKNKEATKNKNRVAQKKQSW